jgi:hypothetical protein
MEQILWTCVISLNKRSTLRTVRPLIHRSYDMSLFLEVTCGHDHASEFTSLSVARFQPPFESAGLKRLPQYQRRALEQRTPQTVQTKRFSKERANSVRVSTVVLLLLAPLYLPFSFASSIISFLLTVSRPAQLCVHIHTPITKQVSSRYSEFESWQCMIFLFTTNQTGHPVSCPMRTGDRTAGP